MTARRWLSLLWSRGARRWTPVASRFAAVLLVAAAAPASVAAQSAAEDRPIRRLEVAVGAGLFGGADIGTFDANLRANSVAPQPYRLFTTDARWAPAPQIEARVGMAFTRRYAVEGTLSFGRPELRSSVSSDAEGAPSLEVSEQVDQYLIDAGLVVMLDEIRLGPLVPVVSAGAGYSRQLHEGRTLVENGRYFHAGVGVRHWLFARPTGLFTSAGVRADVRLYVLDGGIALTDGQTRHGTVSGSVFFVF